ncbi:MAG: hypothetical protein LBI10_11315 [Deltaproteobacteria bacterium]|jgi:hypothetical protein|nr:hypothetical protein [Deltaproteobacteria bacterium]
MTTSKASDLKTENHSDNATWLWVLAAAITVNRDKLLILEDETGEYVPVFLAKEAGEAFLGRLDPLWRQEYQAQAMHIYDIKALASTESYRLLTLDGEGRILDGFSPTEKA